MHGKLLYFTPIRLWRFPLLVAETAKAAPSCPPVAPIVARWRQSWRGGANRGGVALRVAPIGAGPWRQSGLALGRGANRECGWLRREWLGDQSGVWVVALS